ncbi:MAG: toll/interleukin-1 receptor domain-containing protein [Acidobacteriaceae bacterium]|nr:toll/interleukin-1 receptor domain-containing protein [Acidobacteriaceae bacterium]
MSLTFRRKALLEAIDSYLREGAAIEIDGLGSFELEGDRVVFQSNGRPRVFLAYAKEDRAEVRKLYDALQEAGFEPWMDEEKLLPGQNWPRAIERAIDVADFFLICFSRRSVAKRGFFHSELRYALDVAALVPLEEIFLVPVRLCDCDVPLQIARRTQYIDMFPDWEAGVRALTLMMKGQMKGREKRRMKLSK